MVGSQCRTLSLFWELGIVGISLHDACSLCHHCCEVERCCRAFCYDITLLMAVGRQDKVLEFRCCQFVIDTTIPRVLHRQQPSEIVHQLIEQVGRTVSTLGDVHVQPSEIVFTLLVDA